MAWTTPITAAANSTFTAAQWNAGVRDNLALEGPGISTSNGRLIVSNGANVIAEREIQQQVQLAVGTTTSTSYTATLTGGGTSPFISITTGVGALVFMSSALSTTTSNSILVSVSVNAATPVDARAIIQESIAASRDDRYGVTQSLLNLTGGTNTFEMQYKVTGGTGTFQKRVLIVMAL